jgi:hypothetical protein
LHGELSEVVQGPSAGRCAQRARLSSLTAKLVSLDEPEERRGRRVGKPNHVAAEFAKISLDLVRVRFETGVNVAAIASRGAPAGLMSLQKHNVDPPLGEVECGGKAGDTAADDGNARPRIPCEPIEILGWDSGLGVKAGWQWLRGRGRHDVASPYGPVSLACSADGATGCRI